MPAGVQQRRAGSPRQTEPRAEAAAAASWRSAALGVLAATVALRCDRGARRRDPPGRDVVGGHQLPLVLHLI